MDDGLKSNTFDADGRLRTMDLAQTNNVRNYSCDIIEISANRSIEKGKLISSQYLYLMYRLRRASTTLPSIYCYVRNMPLIF